MARKVFISVLGTGLYDKCRYEKADASFVSDETFFIQAATLQFLNAKDWSNGDLGLFLLTGNARELNWNKSITTRFDNRSKKNVDYEGLECVLEKMQLPFSVQDLPIPDGKDEEEIWEIFTRTFGTLRDDDELYFDITHAFRFLPMLILVLCDYAKFLKNVKIKSITYGNYEARNRETNLAPIINLTPISQLQDWTFAAGQYLDSGNVRKMVELKSIVKNDDLKSIIDSLEIVVKERQTCRGQNIHSSENLSALKASLSGYLSKKGNSKPEEEPLHQILKQVDKSLNDFDIKANFMNGFSAAKWCAKNGLYQQAITLLRENFITLFCERHGLDIMNRDQRYIVDLMARMTRPSVSTARTPRPESSRTSATSSF